MLVFQEVPRLERGSSKTCVDAARSQTLTFQKESCCAFEIPARRRYCKHESNLFPLHSLALLLLAASSQSRAPVFSDRKGAEETKC